MAVTESTLVVGPLVPDEGVTTISLDFFFERAEWLEVYRGASVNPLILDSDYSVSGEDTDQGVITLSEAADGETPYVVYLVVPLERDSDFSPRADLRSRTVNLELDRIVQGTQGVRALAQRGLRVSPTSPLPESLHVPDEAARADRFVQFSADGTRLEALRTGQGFDESEAEAKAARDAAQDAASDAQLAEGGAVDARNEAEEFAEDAAQSAALSNRVIYVGTIADLQALNTEPLQDGQQVSVAGGPYAAIFVYDRESTETPNGFTIIEPESEAGRFFLRSGTASEDVNISVPDDFATLQGAVEAASLIRSRSNARKIITIATGHRLTHGLSLTNGGDYSDTIITADDPAVLLDGQFQPVDSSPVGESSSAIFYFENTVAPHLDILIDGEDNYDFDGCISLDSTVFIMPGGGVEGTRMNLEARSSRLTARDCRFSRAARGCIRLTSNSQFEINGSEANNSWSDPPPSQSTASAAVHISRQSSGQAQTLTINDSGFSAITCRRSSVHIDGTTINTTGLSGGSTNTPIRPLGGGYISAGNTTFNGNPLTPANCQVLAFNTPESRGLVFSNEGANIVSEKSRTSGENIIALLSHVKIVTISLESFNLNNPDVTFNVPDSAEENLVGAFLSPFNTSWMGGSGFTSRLAAVNALTVGVSQGQGRIRQANSGDTALDENIDLVVTLIYAPLVE